MQHLSNCRLAFPLLQGQKQRSIIRSALSICSKTHLPLESTFFIVTRPTHPHQVVILAFDVKVSATGGNFSTGLLYAVHLHEDLSLNSLKSRIFKHIPSLFSQADCHTSLTLDYALNNIDSISSDTNALFKMYL